jgi:hypothetical protein
MYTPRDSFWAEGAVILHQTRDPLIDVVQITEKAQDKTRF